jgi:hypothetical protein
MPRKFPPLPKTFGAPLAPVRVVITRFPAPTDKDEDGDYGMWSELTREIRINAAHPRWQQWQSLFHEQTHVALSDSGIDELLTHEMLEGICDAVATQRFRERFG